MASTDKTFAEEIHVCRKVLRLVGELHLRGYQRLRIAPYEAPSGTAWRCAISPVFNITRNHGAMLVVDRDQDARYTSASGREFFGWKDARHATPSRMADLFVKRFPGLVREGQGSDWEYAGWYVELLHLTYPDVVPVAFGNDFDSAIMPDFQPSDTRRDVPRPIPEPAMRCTGLRDNVLVPMPPPGQG